MDKLKKINYVYEMDGPEGIREMDVTNEIYACGGIQKWYHSVKPVFGIFQGKRTLYKVNDDATRTFIFDVP